MRAYAFRCPSLAVLALTLLSGSAAAGKPAADSTADTTTVQYAVKTELVQYKSGRDTVHAVLYTPDVKGKRPGVVTIHEWWGLNDWARESAKKIAERGYVTLAIDLYRGHVADNADDAHELMRGVPEDRARRDLQTAVEYLRSKGSVDRARIGVVGWCMGGGYALETALAVPDLAACVVCYGHLVSEDETIQQISAPVLGIFGADDKGIPAESVRQFEKQARALGKDVTVHLYEGAGHAFMNVNNNRGYNADATSDAWGRIFAFLGRTLGEPSKK
jgi:carboxymethylenebutenolidase